MQSLEILPVFLRAGRVHWLWPEHADSLRVGWPTAAEPARLVQEALAVYGPVARLVHSTSWRHEGDHVVLTFVAVVPAEQAPHASGGPLVPCPVGHVELARGEATAPPESVDVEQVLEHALRHLSWLVGDDPVVAEELRDWAGTLRSYEPEPFRAL